MDADERRSRGTSPALLMAAALAIVSAWEALADPLPEQWTLANEYPATSLPGEGDADFSRRVAERSRGRLSIVAIADAKAGYKSREQLKAVAEGKVAMADTFGGAIGGDEAIFALASLPFVVGDIAQARSLYEAARPAYERAFARHNQKLLYATPWPASGLWTKAPVDSVEALAKLRIRAYDRTGEDLFSRLGAKASVVSFADLAPKLASGEIDAVLSSGDGGAARKLWEQLPRFTEINYAIPLSFTTVNLDRWNSLDAETRGAVAGAAAETEARQWKALEGRLEQNYKRMREQGMTIDTSVPRALRERMREAARETVDAWAATAGPEGEALVATLRKDR